jgi:hypothetical protein
MIGFSFPKSKDFPNDFFIFQIVLKLPSFRLGVDRFGHPAEKIDVISSNSHFEGNSLDTRLFRSIPLMFKIPKTA